MLIDVTLPVGSWQIAARPRGGWSPDPKTLWRNRLLYLAAGFLILCPTFLAGRLSRKRLEVIPQLEARESELERLSLVAQHATYSIVLTDPQTNVTWVNDAFQRLTEYTRDEAMGATLTELLSGPDTDMDTVAAINDHKARGLPFQAEILNYTKSGKPIWVETHIVPILEEAGKVTMIIGVERDITHTSPRISI